MEAKCKNCAHFSSLQGKLTSDVKHLESIRGECNKIIDGEDHAGENLPNDCVIIWNGGGYDRTVVGVNFGCIHFEDRRISELQEKLEKLEWHVNSIKDPHAE